MQQQTFLRTNLWRRYSRICLILMWHNRRQPTRRQVAVYPKRILLALQETPPTTFQSSKFIRPRMETHKLLLQEDREGRVYAAQASLICYLRIVCRAAVATIIISSRCRTRILNLESVPFSQALPQQTRDQSNQALFMDLQTTTKILTIPEHKTIQMALNLLAAAQSQPSLIL